MKRSVFTAVITCSLLSAALSVLLSCDGGGQTAAVAPPAPVTQASGIFLTQVGTGFSSPVAITNAGDGSGRLFVAEQGGAIRILSNGVVAHRPFLNISSLITSGGEQGLLGLAFPPSYAIRQSFYVNYINRTGIGNTVIARFAAGSDPDFADPASRQELLTIVQPFANHNGGQLVFGPDRLLYIGSGDGGSAGDPLGNGQNTASLLGKILRLDVLSGTAPAIPAGNPFGSEVWAYGLRNPWRFSFDRQTGDLYVADVGQDTREEINFQSAGSGAGGNYGWNVMEGSLCYLAPGLCSSAGLTLPVVEYGHTVGNCSVTGGFVYRGSIPSLRGTYLYGDFCSGMIWGLRRNGSAWENLLLLDSPLLISAFGEDEGGNSMWRTMVRDRYSLSVPREQRGALTLSSTF